MQKKTYVWTVLGQLYNTVSYAVQPKLYKDEIKRITFILDLKLSVAPYNKNEIKNDKVNKFKLLKTDGQCFELIMNTTR